MTAALIALAALLTADPPMASALGPKLEAIAATHKGKIAIGFKHLATGDEFFLRGDDVMPTASLIKVAVMVETFRLFEERKFNFDHKLTLTKDDTVPGAGVLTDSFSPGATFSLLDAVRLMITVSDNTATNMVLDTITIPATNATMAKLGFPETRINAKVFKGSTTSVDPKRTEKYGLGSTTAREMTGLFELIATRKAVSPTASDEMLGILKKNHDNEMLMRGFPNGTTFAHKTGAVTSARTDAGVLYFGGKPAVVICVLTDGNADKRWLVDNDAQLVISKVGRAVYDHFAPPPAPAKAEPPKK